LFVLPRGGAGRIGSSPVGMGLLHVAASSGQAVLVRKRAGGQEISTRALPARPCGVRFSEPMGRPVVIGRIRLPSKRDHFCNFVRFRVSCNDRDLIFALHDLECFSNAGLPGIGKLAH